MNENADRTAAGRIRTCTVLDYESMLHIINAAAEAYRGIIPADRWHDPYMPRDELDREIASGVRFSVFQTGQGLAGVMGVQRVRNIDLIRHAYVLPAWQGRSVGSALLAHLCHDHDRQILIGTWRAATWAIRFYERHGFTRCSSEDAAVLLRTYWTVPGRQIATSVVLSSVAMDTMQTAQLIAHDSSL